MMATYVVEDTLSDGSKTYSVFLSGVLELIECETENAAEDLVTSLTEFSTNIQRYPRCVKESS